VKLVTTEYTVVRLRVKIGGVHVSQTAHPSSVAVVGAGFAGLYALHALRQSGFSVVGLEAGADVGGVWFWNRYPGARCDVESVDYSFSFSAELEQEFDWSERYAAQPEILEYLRHVARRFGLYDLIRFGTRVVEARFDTAHDEWALRTADGDEVRSRYVVLATGPLSVPLTPRIPGLSEFAGTTYFTSRWPDGPVDFTGRRVGVIGTGSSGIQCIPPIAESAEHLHVFQRTANFSIPAQNAPLTAEELREIKAGYRERRALALQSRGGSPHRYRADGAMSVGPQERHAEFERAWLRGGTHFTKAFADITSDAEANSQAVAFVHEKIRSIVPDPAVAEVLMPKDHPLGSKRICADTGYYATFARDNVSLVDLKRTPILAVEPAGVRTTEGLITLDTLVMATGFDALSGSYIAAGIHGSDGTSLAQAWQRGPTTYLGMAVAGFPNLFLLSGPGSPSVLANMVRTAEQQVEWVAGLLRYARENAARVVEVDPDAQREWDAHVRDAVEGTLFLQAKSWYVGANVPGKPQVFMPYAGGQNVYRAECDEVAADNYRGFVLRGTQRALA
jgi:cyclohexanone monooxygenase